MPWRGVRRLTSMDLKAGRHACLERMSSANAALAASQLKSCRPLAASGSRLPRPALDDGMLECDTASVEPWRRPVCRCTREKLLRTSPSLVGATGGVNDDIIAMCLATEGQHATDVQARSNHDAAR